MALSITIDNELGFLTENSSLRVSFERARPSRRSKASSGKPATRS
jgi:hypothetical protein